LNVDKNFIVDDWAIDADDAGVETEVFDESTRLVHLWEFGHGWRRDAEPCVDECGCA